MERKCAECKQIIQIDSNNSNQAILYEKKYYDYECFQALCQRRMKRSNTREQWTVIYSNIDQLVDNTTNYIKELATKDELFWWVCGQYNVSQIDNFTFMKLENIYNGTFKGQAYPIKPQELFDEWKYCIKDLRRARANKTMDGNAEIRYDLSVLLNWNADYRKEIKRREAEKQQEKIEIENRPKIDCAKLYRQNTKHTNDTDVLDMFNDIFG